MSAPTYHLTYYVGEPHRPDARQVRAWMAV